MEKLTGIIKYDNGFLPFFMNDFVFDFVPLEIHPMQYWLPPETIQTKNEFITGFTHSGHYIAIYVGSDHFRINSTSSIHTCIYITSKNNASDIWQGGSFDGISFFGGCINKIYQSSSMNLDSTFKSKDEIKIKVNDTKKEFEFIDSNNRKIRAFFETNINQAQDFEKGFFIKEDGQYVNFIFEKQKHLKDVKEILNCVQNIFSTLLFRRELFFDKIYLTKKNKNGNQIAIAELHLETKFITSKKPNNVISINDLGIRAAKYFENIWNKRIGSFEYIPKNDSESIIFHARDVKEICSALEYEIDNTPRLLIKEKSELNELTTRVKDSVKTYRKSSTCLSTKTYDLIFSNIRNWSHPLSEQIISLWQKHRKAITICSNNYGLKLTKKRIESFVKYRNNTSHGDNASISQDLANTAIMLECLLYCSILARSGFTKVEIQNICRNRRFLL